MAVVLGRFTSMCARTSQFPSIAHPLCVFFLKTLLPYCFCSVVLFLQPHPNWGAVMDCVMSAQNPYVETLTLRVYVIVFGDGAFKELITLKGSH